MRLVVSVSCVLLVVGCAGPHSNGALWAEQNLELELARGRLTDAQRADQAQTYELMLADEDLDAERTRVRGGLQDCPGGARQPLLVSTGDRVRDAIRLRVGDEAQRQAVVAQVALADWRVRRGRATGDGQFCDEARQALTGAASGEPSAAELLASRGSATVTRDPQRQHGSTTDPAGSIGASAASRTSLYALGYIDTVRAPAPLPQYLAAVYGGVVIETDRLPALNGQTPEEVVDRFAPAYPEWEPDAIYAAVRSA